MADVTIVTAGSSFYLPSIAQSVVTPSLYSRTSSGDLRCGYSSGYIYRFVAFLDLSLLVGETIQAAKLQMFCLVNDLIGPKLEVRAGSHNEPFTYSDPGLFNLVESSALWTSFGVAAGLVERYFPADAIDELQEAITSDSGGHSICFKTDTEGPPFNMTFLRGFGVRLIITLKSKAKRTADKFAGNLGPAFNGGIGG